MMRSLSLTVALLLSIARSPSAAAEKAVGDRATEFVRVVDGKGRAVRLAKYDKALVVLTFGASWCAPCKAELPALNALARRYRGRKVVFLAVNIDSDSSAGKAFMRALKLDRIVALFDTAGATVKSYDPATMPTTFFIKSGIVVHVHRGYRRGDDAKLARAIDAHL